MNSGSHQPMRGGRAPLGPRPSAPRQNDPNSQLDSMLSDVVVTKLRQPPPPRPTQAPAAEDDYENIEYYDDGSYDVYAYDEVDEDGPSGAGGLVQVPEEVLDEVLNLRLKVHGLDSENAALKQQLDQQKALMAQLQASLLLGPPDAASGQASRGSEGVAPSAGVTGGEGSAGPGAGLVTPSCVPRALSPVSTSDWDDWVAAMPAGNSNSPAPTVPAAPPASYARAAIPLPPGTVLDLLTDTPIPIPGASITGAAAPLTPAPAPPARTVSVDSDGALAAILAVEEYEQQQQTGEDRRAAAQPAVSGPQVDEWTPYMSPPPPIVPQPAVPAYCPPHLTPQGAYPAPGATSWAAPVQGGSTWYTPSASLPAYPYHPTSSMQPISTWSPGAGSTGASTAPSAAWPHTASVTGTSSPYSATSSPRRLATPSRPAQPEAAWRCSACTYLHEGSQATYLRCAVCNALK